MATKASSKSKMNVGVLFVVAVLIALVLLMFKLSNRASDTTEYQTPSDASYSSGNVDLDVSTMERLLESVPSSDFEATGLQ